MQPITSRANDEYKNGPFRAAAIVRPSRPRNTHSPDATGRTDGRGATGATGSATPMAGSGNNSMNLSNRQANAQTGAHSGLVGYISGPERKAIRVPRPRVTTSGDEPDGLRRASPGR